MKKDKKSATSQVAMKRKHRNIPIRDLLPHGAMVRVAAKHINPRTKKAMSVQNVARIAKGLVDNPQVYADLQEEIRADNQKQIEQTALRNTFLAIKNQSIQTVTQ